MADPRQPAIHPQKRATAAAWFRAHCRLFLSPWDRRYNPTGTAHGDLARELARYVRRHNADHPDATLTGLTHREFSVWLDYYLDSHVERAANRSVIKTWPIWLRGRWDDPASESVYADLRPAYYCRGYHPPYRLDEMDFMEVVQKSPKLELLCRRFPELLEFRPPRYYGPDKSAKKQLSGGAA